MASSGEKKVFPASVDLNLFVPMPAKLVQARMLTATERHLTFSLPDAALGHQPGQFVQVSILGCEEAPISICSGDGAATFELCVRRAGKLTAALHQLEPGMQVGIRGPFGRGFPVHEMSGSDLVMVAGGIGLAPMRSLVQYCLAHRDRFGRLVLLLGTKRPSDVLFSDDLDDWARQSIEVQRTVDVAEEGYRGRVGLVTTLIGSLNLNAARTTAVIVGPPIMYAHVVNELIKAGLSREQMIVSLERHMRCGVGKCGHCMIEDAFYVCCDGPVFRLSELARVKGAL